MSLSHVSYGVSFHRAGRLVRVSNLVIFGSCVTMTLSVVFIHEYHTTDILYLYKRDSFVSINIMLTCSA